MPDPVRMHADEVAIDEALVRDLLRAQFPRWADLPVAPVASAGTDHALFRLGDDLVARLPRLERVAEQVHKDHRWLPRLAPRLPLPVPVPLALGEPEAEYPWHWSVCRWLDGADATVSPPADLGGAAAELARFVTALQRIDPAGGPVPGQHNFGRGVPLAERDAATRAAIRELHGMIDTDAVTTAWESALQASPWPGPPVWIHGDLAPGNLLVAHGKLSAVIDFGGLAVGDPACDLMVAWTLFSGASRDTFRAAVAADNSTWARGRGWALSWALIFIAYYLATNPVGVAAARTTIAALLADRAK